MPEFQLNRPSAASHPYYDLDEFAQSYVEAMFFTNCDSGDEREDRANALGVERLTKASTAAIAADCALFQSDAARLLSEACGRGYTADQAGRDFWFTRQGHGAGFWDRDMLDAGALGERLSTAATAFGEADVVFRRGWIHYC